MSSSFQKAWILGLMVSVAGGCGKKAVEPLEEPSKLSELEEQIQAQRQSITQYLADKQSCQQDSECVSYPVSDSKDPLRSLVWSQNQIDRTQFNSLQDRYTQLLTAYEKERCKNGCTPIVDDTGMLMSSFTQCEAQRCVFRAVDERLKGTYYLITMHPSNPLIAPKPIEREITLTLGTDAISGNPDSVSGIADCNSYSGIHGADKKGNIGFRNISRSKVGCINNEGTQYLDKLEKVQRYAITLTADAKASAITLYTQDGYELHFMTGLKRYPAPHE